jgi:hypothetical protein
MRRTLGPESGEAKMQIDNRGPDNRAGLVNI